MSGCGLVKVKRMERRIQAQLDVMIMVTIIEAFEDRLIILTGVRLHPPTNVHANFHAGSGLFCGGPGCELVEVNRIEENSSFG